MRWHDVTTISSSNLLDSARETCARAPDLQRKNDRRCSPNGPPQTNGVTIVVIIGLLLHHARTSLVAWAEAQAAGGHTPFGTSLGVLRFRRFSPCRAVRPGSESRTGAISFRLEWCPSPGTRTSSMMARYSMVPILSPGGANKGGITRPLSVTAVKTITEARCLLRNTWVTSGRLVAMIWGC